MNTERIFPSTDLFHGQRCHFARENVCILAHFFPVVAKNHSTRLFSILHAKVELGTYLWGNNLNTAKIFFWLKTLLHYSKFSRHFFSPEKYAVLTEKCHPVYHLVRCCFPLWYHKVPLLSVELYRVSLSFFAAGKWQSWGEKRLRSFPALYSANSNSSPSIQLLGGKKDSYFYTTIGGSNPYYKSTSQLSFLGRLVAQ